MAKSLKMTSGEVGDAERRVGGAFWAIQREGAGTGAGPVRFQKGGRGGGHFGTYDWNGVNLMGACC